MEQITLGQIGMTITFLVGIIGGIGYVIKHMKEWISKALSDQLQSIDGKIEGLQTRIENVDMNACKNYLVDFLSRVEKGDLIDEIERERFWEQYQHYIHIGGNSYIKRKVEQLKKEGKL